MITRLLGFVAFNAPDAHFRRHWFPITVAWHASGGPTQGAKKQPGHHPGVFKKRLLALKLTAPPGSRTAIRIFLSLTGGGSARTLPRRRRRRRAAAPTAVPFRALPREVPLPLAPASSRAGRGRRFAALSPRAVSTTCTALPRSGCRGPPRPQTDRPSRRPREPWRQRVHISAASAAGPPPCNQPTRCLGTPSRTPRLLSLGGQRSHSLQGPSHPFFQFAVRLLCKVRWLHRRIEPFLCGSGVAFLCHA